MFPDPPAKVMAAVPEATPGHVRLSDAFTVPVSGTVATSVNICDEKQLLLLKPMEAVKVPGKSPVATDAF